MLLAESCPVAVAVIVPTVVVGSWTVAVVFVARAGDVAMTVEIVANYVLRVVVDGIPHIPLVVIDVGGFIVYIGMVVVPIVFQPRNYAPKAVVLSQRGVAIMDYANFAPSTV
jgi:hypothetical protein